MLKSKPIPRSSCMPRPDRHGWLDLVPTTRRGSLKSSVRLPTLKRIQTSNTAIFVLVSRQTKKLAVVRTCLMLRSSLSAYTIDGGPIGGWNLRTSMLRALMLSVGGVNVHPGTAKGKMVNSMNIAAQFQLMMPAQETPECRRL